MYRFPTDFGPLAWALKRNRELVRGIDAWSRERVCGEGELDSRESRAVPLVRVKQAGPGNSADRERARALLSLESELVPSGAMKEREVPSINSGESLNAMGGGSCKGVSAPAHFEGVGHE